MKVETVKLAARGWWSLGNLARGSPTAVSWHCMLHAPPLLNMLFGREHIKNTQCRDAAVVLLMLKLLRVPDKTTAKRPPLAC